MLEPPVDPLRPRMRKTEPLYKPSTSNGNEGLGLGLGLGTSVGGNGPSGGGSGGFDLDAVPQFDTNVDYNKDWSQSQSGGSSDEGSKSKPFWKIW